MGDEAASPFQVRGAVFEDLPALAALDARSWTLASAPVHVDGGGWSRDPSGFETTLVALESGALCGYVHLDRAFPARLTSAAHVARLRGICVSPEARGRGLATLLLHHAEALARTHGYRKIVLQALSTNTPAHRTYARAGYVVEGRVTRCFLLEGQWVDDLHFGKWLE